MKKNLTVFVRTSTVIILLVTGCVYSLNLIGCGGDEAETDQGISGLTVEDQKDLARFVEYVFFPTSPYVDKSWVETDVPEEELANKPIDFPAETAAIQHVYTEVYNAWKTGDFDTVAANFYPSTIRFVFLCACEPPPQIRRVLSTDSIRKPWNVCNCPSQFELSQNPLLTEFYVRRKHVQAPWPEASAKTADKTYLYLTKRDDRWYINELVWTGNHLYTDRGDTRKYFEDPKYKAP